MAQRGPIGSSSGLPHVQMSDAGRIVMPIWSGLAIHLGPGGSSLVGAASNGRSSHRSCYHELPFQRLVRVVHLPGRDRPGPPQCVCVMNGRYCWWFCDMKMFRHVARLCYQRKMQSRLHSVIEDA
jgi:hypothetical protein